MSETGKRLASVYFSAFVNESRAFRQAMAVIDAGLVEDVVFLGYQDEGLPVTDQPIERGRTQRLPMPALPRLPRLPRRALQWVVWTWAAARAIEKAKPKLIQAHSLAALPSAVIAKSRLEVPLLYDAHELESERTGWGRAQKLAARVLERTLIGRCDHTVVVSGSIADWYRRTYRGLEPSVIRNLPLPPRAPATRNQQLRDNLGLGDTDQIFLYLGALGEGRGLELLIDAFTRRPPHQHLVMMGNGPLVDEIKATAAKRPNIHWHAPVAPTDVVTMAAGADVGLSLIEDTCLSYRYCLPNKLFECRLAGLPVIASDLDEIRAFITEHSGGWLVQPDVASLDTLLATLDAEEIARQAALARAYQPTWADEAPAFVAIVRKLCASGRSA